jgi:hypothetical protein
VQPEPAWRIAYRSPGNPAHSSFVVRCVYVKEEMRSGFGAIRRLAQACMDRAVKEKCRRCKARAIALTILLVMAKNKEKTFEVACPDCGAMLKIDAETGVLVSHTSAPRKRMFEDLETAAKAMREHGERTESIFRQSVDAEKNKEDLFEKRFAEAMRKAKDTPAEGKPLREIDLD